MGTSRFFLTSFLILSLLLLNNCNSVEPPSGLEINLKLEDVSCTEAWITLSSNIKLPATIELKQNTQVIKTINLNSPDSLLYINSLQANTAYTFEASNSGNNVSSNNLQVTTIAATSHDFTFETFTFGGDAGSCALYDVAIINENNIIAVGEIYLLDSLGQPDPQAYGVAIWEASACRD